jgi:hypothetical protein
MFCAFCGAYRANGLAIPIYSYEAMSMRQLAIVGAGLTLAGILIAMTMGVFMEINIGSPTWLSTSHAIKPNFSAQLQSAQRTKPAGMVAIQATPEPQFVTITQSVLIDTEMLPVGRQLEFISKHGSDVWVRYKNGEYAIPTSATNLK